MMTYAQQCNTDMNALLFPNYILMGFKAHSTEENIFTGLQTQLRNHGQNSQAHNSTYYCHFAKWTYYHTDLHISMPMD